MKNIKTKILVSLIALVSLANTADAATIPGVALVVTPASLNETVGNTFSTAVVVRTPGSKVYAVEGTLTFDGLSCQSITISDGLISQTAPTCTKPYFLVGVPSGTIADKEIFRVGVKALRAGNVTIGLTSIDVIGEGMSLSNVGTGAKYSIVENATSTDTPDQEVNAPIIAYPKIQTRANEVAAETEPASSTPATQLAAVAEFVTTNSMMFWTLGLLALVLGYRYFTRRYEIVVVPEKNTSPTQKGDK